MAYFSFKNNADYNVDFNGCECMSDSAKNSRYILEIQLEQYFSSEKTAIAVLMNPSSTAKAHIFCDAEFDELSDVDRTTNNVLKSFFNGVTVDGKTEIQKYSKVIFCNLFPYMTPNSKDLNVIYGNKNGNYLNIAEMCKNFLIMEHTIFDNPNADVFCGWGRATEKGVTQSTFDPAIEIFKNQVMSVAKNSFYYFNRGKFKKLVSDSATFYVPHASTWKGVDDVKRENKAKKPKANNHIKSK